MQDRTNGPGIGLMVVGGLAILYALASVPLNMFQFANNPQLQETLPKAAQFAIAAIVAVIYVIVGVVILLGGMKMRGLQGYGLAMAGAILAMIPCCDGPCCLLGLPLGIWALVVLMDQQVKQAFTS